MSASSIKWCGERDDVTKETEIIIEQMSKEQRKSIVYLGGFNLPNANAAAQRVVANAKLLRELGYNVMLVGLSDNDNINKTFLYEGFQCINLKYPHSAIEWLKYLASYRQYMPFVQIMNPFAVIAYNHPSIAMQRLTEFCRRNGIKMLADCTEWYEPHGSWFFRKIKGWDSNKRMTEVHCNMDGVIAISKFLYDFYTKRGVKTLLLPPLVDKQEGKWHQTTGQEDGIIRLVFAGSIDRGYKDRLDVIVEALSRIEKKLSSTFILDIIGINEEQFRNTFTEWKDKTLPSFVRFHGRIDHEETIKMLIKSDFQIFVRDNSLSNTAGFPTKFVETISARSLVLTNPSSNIGDYLFEGVNGYILDIKNIDILTDCLMVPLSLNIESIKEKRRKMNADVFDYRNYVSNMEHFIKNL